VRSTAARNTGKALNFAAVGINNLADNGLHENPRMVANTNQGDKVDTNQTKIESMKTAQALVEELSRHVMPPLGLAIILSERPSNYSDDPNWVAATGAMDQGRLDRFNQKVAELRKTDRLIDWSGVEGKPGQRRVALWGSELKEQNAPR
jgi:hypothetical protein